MWYLFRLCGSSGISVGSLRHSACLPSWWDLNANPCLSSSRQILKYFSWASWSCAGTWLNLVWRFRSFHLCLLPLQDFFLSFWSLQPRFFHSSKTTAFCLSFVPRPAVLNQKCPQRRAWLSAQCCARMFASQGREANTSCLQGSCASSFLIL